MIETGGKNGNGGELGVPSSSQNQLEIINPINIRLNPRRMVSETFFSSNDTGAGMEIVEKELYSSRTSHTDEGNDNEGESLEETRPVKKPKVSHRAEAESYAIDSMKYETTQLNLDRLRETYSIPSDIDLKILSKNNTSSCPPRGYVTFYLECFKLGTRLPLQPYFAQILSRLNLALGQLNPNR